LKRAPSSGYDGHLNSGMEASARDRQIINIDVARDFDKIGAFKEDRINISVGDEIRFTDNDKRLGVKNGHSGKVKAMDEDGNVTVYSHELKRDVAFSLHDSMDGARRYKHVALGYAVSTEGSQGMTRDFVIGALNVKPQPASNDLHVLIRESRSRLHQPAVREMEQEPFRIRKADMKSPSPSGTKGGTNGRQPHRSRSPTSQKTGRTPATPRWLRSASTTTPCPTKGGRRSGTT
jgi:hypothetical protein